MFLLAAKSVMAIPACRDILEPKVLSIQDLKKDGTASRIRENFKLTLTNLFQVIENHYGPLQFKMASRGLNWDQIKREALKRAASLTNEYDQSMEISRILSLVFNDGHVSTRLPSTLLWNLPLQFHMAGEQYYIGFIDSTYPSQLLRPQVGDQLLRINGLEPFQFQRRFPQFQANGNPLTNKVTFGYQLTNLREGQGFPLRELGEPVLHLQLKRKESGDLYEISVPYIVDGTGLIYNQTSAQKGLKTPIQNVAKHDPPPSPGPQDSAAQLAAQVHALFRAEILDQNIQTVTAQKASGKTEGVYIRHNRLFPVFKLPAHFKPLDIPDAVKNDSRFREFLVSDLFYAGTFERNGKRIGYLKIPTYSPRIFREFPTRERALPATIRFFIGKLEAETDALIIDQTDNPGGRVTMADYVIKSLVGEYNPDRHMRFAVKPSQGLIRRYRDTIDSIRKNEDKIFSESEIAELTARLEVELEKILKAHEKGHDLSEPISSLALADYLEILYDRKLFELPWRPLLESLTGVNVQKPQTYTKPLFVLINENSFSAGDAVPAMIQDYGRGLLIGTRDSTQTAGAGGHVETFSLRSQLDIEIGLTTSLMVRYDGRLIENYGVKADINVPIQPEDIQNSYQTYFERVLEVVDKKLQ